MPKFSLITHAVFPSEQENGTKSLPFAIKKTVNHQNLG